MVKEKKGAERRRERENKDKERRVSVSYYIIIYVSKEALSYRERLSLPSTINPSKVKKKRKGCLLLKVTTRYFNSYYPCSSRS